MGFAIAGFWLHRAGILPHLPYSAYYSAQGAFGRKKVPKRAAKTARRGASAAYRKITGPSEVPRGFAEQSRVKAEGLNPSPHGLEFLNGLQTRESWSRRMRHRQLEGVTIPVWKTPYKSTLFERPMRLLHRRGVVSYPRKPSPTDQSSHLRLADSLRNYAW